MIRILTLSFCLMGLALMVVGCSEAGLVANAAVGNSTVDAKYKPPKEPTLVLVENFRTAAGGDVDCDRVGRFLSSELTDHEVVPLVDFAKLTALRDGDPEGYRKMSVAAIGQAVGAKQVIYVSLNDFSSDSPIGGTFVKWKASVKVKVVDSATGASRWPVDLTDGEPLVAETDYKEADPDIGELAIRDELNKKLAEKIGNLFHSYQKDSDSAEDYQQ
ncbi:MAG: hypothetical protein ABSH22_03745 [Tepidisphaeraceae bacterium]